MVESQVPSSVICYVVEGDPRSDLMNKLLALLSEEKRIPCIITELWEAEDWDWMQNLLHALRRMHESEQTFRSCVMKLYQEHFGSDSVPFQVTSPLQVLLLLHEILSGWTWKDYSDAPNTLVEDAEECFLFLCWVYKRALHTEDPKQCRGNARNAELREKIDGLFAEHLRRGRWHPNELDPWIARDEVPKELALVLTKARARLLNGEQAKDEAKIRAAQRQSA